jgi:hypothetical protein
MVDIISVSKFERMADILTISETVFLGVIVVVILAGSIVSAISNYRLRKQNRATIAIKTAEPKAPMSPKMLGLLEQIETDLYATKPKTKNIKRKSKKAKRSVKVKK